MERIEKKLLRIASSGVLYIEARRICTFNELELDSIKNPVFAHMYIRTGLEIIFSNCQEVFPMEKNGVHYRIVLLI